MPGIDEEFWLHDLHSVFSEDALELGRKIQGTGKETSCDKSPILLDTNVN